MHILLLGAGGFIGRHILSDLLAHGHAVTAIVRRTEGLDSALPDVTWIARDLTRMTAASDWRPVLAGVDLVVNAAGVLSGRDMDEVHVAMPHALHLAAKESGVRRVILISAISARPDVDTDYAQSKLAGEADLRASGCAWTILRPSLVYGDGSYGGTSLMRGLAALPLAIPRPGDGSYAFTPIHARDLAHAVRVVCEDDRFAGQVLEPVGPETLQLDALLARYRAWLGFGKARFVPVPLPVLRLLGRIGDLTGGGPMASNSVAQMVAGNAGDSAGFADAIGFAPRSLDAALCDRPAQVQDRWHARLFFLAPAIRAVLVLIWVASALLGLVYGAAETTRVVAALGLPGDSATPMRIAGTIIDLTVACVVAFDRRGRLATVVQIAVVLTYSAILGVVLPALWLDPLGPLLKNLPVLALILVHGAIGNRR